MSLVSSIESVRKWMYYLNEITIYVENEKFTIPNERINAFNLSCQFEKNFFPVFSITIVLESSRYYKILKNKKTATFRLNIGKVYKYNGSDEESLVRDFINQNFSLILDDDDIDSNSSTKRLEASQNFESMMNSDDNDLFYTDNEVTFYLFPSDAINNSKTNVNAILKKCTMEDAVGYILSEAAFTKVLMTPFENTEEKDLIVIPPMQAFKAIQFLDTYYGFYRSGALYFNDFDYLYILKYNSDCSAYTSDEKQEVDIIIPDMTSEYITDLCGTLQDGDTYYNIVTIPSNISFRNTTVSKNAISGIDVMTIDNYTGDIQKSNVNAETGSGTRNTSIMENETENTWITDIHSSQTEMNSTVVNVILTDIDLSALKPNRRYKIIFEDPLYTEKYNGIFMISGYEAKFVKKGLGLTMSAVCTFKRITTK